MHMLHVLLLLLLQDFTLTSQCACPTTSGVCGGHTSNNDVSLKESSDPGVVGIVLMCL